MANMLKCTQCGGTKFKDIDENTYKCVYCGAKFKKEKEPMPSIAPPPTIATSQNTEFGYKGNTAQESREPRYVRVGYKSRGVTLLLTFLLGAFGGHHFYLGHIGRGILYLIFCWTYIPCFLSLLEFFYYLFMGSQEFDRKYNFKRIH